MRTLILHRLVMAVLTLFVVSVTTFVLVSVAPGDPARAILGATGTPEQYAALRERLGLDLPLWQQYGNYISQIFTQGTLGNSLLTNEPVIDVLNDRLPVTLSLVIASMIVTAIVAVLLGTFSALRPGFLGKLVDVVSMAGLALPNFWLGLILVAIFAVQLRLLPAVGYVPLLESPGGWILSLILPVTALALSGIGTLTKIARDGMLEINGRDFMRTLRANGMSRRSLLWKHALKNVSINLVTILSIIVMGSLTGTVFVETVFAMPGLGSLATSATLSNDIPVVQGVALYFTLMVIAVNLIVDVAYGWLNPKVRTAS